jgi:thiol:disulfide interchange protein DsbD
MRGLSSRRRHAVPLLAAAAWAMAAGAGAAPPSSKHVQVQLVPEVESIRPGQPFTVGLQLRMDPEWHTYWKNPGDSGLPTRLTWTLPEGFQAGPIQWPYPGTFTQGPVTSYGYAGEVLLAVAITPPPALAVGTSVTLAARADWLECREACLPGRRDLSLVLPVRSEAPRPSAQWAPAFAAARARVPAPGTGWTFEAQQTADQIVLNFHPPRTQPPIRGAYFFPDRGQVIDHAARQTFTHVIGGYRLEMTPAPNAARPLGALEGVLLTHGISGIKAVRVDAKSAGAGGQTKGAGRRPPSPKEKP